MKKNRFSIYAAVLGMVALGACAEIPQEQIDAAATAVANTQAGEAELYAKSDFVALQDSLKSAQELVAQEDSKFLFKNFDASTAKLQGVVAQASTVTEKAKSNKEALIASIGSIKAETNSLIDANNELIAAAPKGKEGNSALLAIKGELDGVSLVISQSDSLLANNEIFASLDKAKAAKDKATSLNTELSEVISKFQGAKRK
ncbi:MAG: hypothetical protein ACI83W_002075 [Marinoscillum sp.]|jgi:hypothetical protein